MDSYREKVIVSYIYLIKAQDNLIDRIINIGMCGEFQEIGDTFATGDIYRFDIDQFRNTDDITLNALIHLYDELEKASDLLCNINSITEKEIAEVLPNWKNLTSTYFIDEDNDRFGDFDDFALGEEE